MRAALLTLLFITHGMASATPLTEPLLARVPGEDGPLRCIIPGFPLRDDLRLIVILDGPYRGITELLGRKDIVVVGYVGSPSDLRGRVEISTAQQALAFCRLFTADDTCEVGFVYDAGTEVIRSLEVVAKSQAPKRRWGVVDDTVARRFGLKPAAVRWDRDHWIVERNLIVIGWVKHGEYQGDGQVYRSHEIVYPDGCYVHQRGPFVEGDLGRAMDLPGPMY
jgi:hypothetical protein